MIYSYVPFGYEGSLVNVEVDLRRGIPAVDIVGISDASVKEVRERVLAAIRNSGFEFPAERVLISLSPADLRKEGAQTDLAIALAIMEAQYNALNKNENRIKESFMVMGELELSGKVLPVKALHPALSYAGSSGIKWAIVPKNSGLSVPPDVRVVYVDSLEEAWNAIIKINRGEKVDYATDNSPREKDEDSVMFMALDGKKPKLDGIHLLPSLKFAMAVAVSGRHNIMAIGSPGCGKTVILQNMPEITPCLLPSEQASVTRIYSLAGLSTTRDYANGYATVRPFRIPHQTASIEGICGGGVNCRPGEITLAHNGTLFLDEAAEFRSSVLQMLRVPLETHQITLSRAGRTTVFPAHFQLAMALNPCPCGNYGLHSKICLCSAKSIDQYWKKVSAPLLDRVEIKINCSEDEVDPETGKSVTPDVLKVKDFRAMVETAWKKQLKRQCCFNTDLTPEDIIRYCVLDDKSRDELDKVVVRYGLSSRNRMAIIKVARTLADMANADNICLDDIKSAIKMCRLNPTDL